MVELLDSGYGRNYFHLRTRVAQCLPRKEAPLMSPSPPRRAGLPTVSPFALAGNEEKWRPHRSWQARRAASPPLSGPGHLRSHPHTGRSGYPLLSSRGHRLRLRPVGGASIQGCSRAHRFLHGGAPRGTCPGRPPSPTAAAATAAYTYHFMWQCSL